MLPILEPLLQDFAEGTVAWYAQRRIDDAEMLPLSPSHYYQLRGWQKAAMGKKRPEALLPADFIEFARGRRADGVLPQTIQNDVACLRALLFRFIKFGEIKPEVEVVVKTAWGLLQDDKLIAKGKPRRRLPSAEELQAVRAGIVERNKRGRAKIDLTDFLEFALVSTRRLSEITDIQRQHIDIERRMCKLRPKKSDGEWKEFPLLGEMWDIVQRRLAAIPDEPTARLFPFNPKSAGQAYAKVLKKAGIVGLRFHDNRAEAITRWLGKFGTARKVKMISLHSTEKQIESTYDRETSESLHAEFARIQAALAAVELRHS